MCEPQGRGGATPSFRHIIACNWGSFSLIQAAPGVGAVAAAAAPWSRAGAGAKTDGSREGGVQENDAAGNS